MEITLLGRADCHLCDDAAVVLTALGSEYDLTITAIDIDNDDALVREYGLRIPVVLGPKGHLLAEGIISERSLRSALEGTSAR